MSSGIVFAVVESGKDWPTLRGQLRDCLDVMGDYCRDESGLEPELVGLGSAPEEPPDADTWRQGREN